MIWYGKSWKRLQDPKGTSIRGARYERLIGNASVAPGGHRLLSLSLKIKSTPENTDFLGQNRGVDIALKEHGTLK